MKTFLIILSVLGGVLLLGAIVWLVWQLTDRKKLCWNKRTILTVVAFVVGLALLLVPMLVLNGNGWTTEGKRIPLIQEKTYQDSTFTVNGKVYEATGLHLYDMSVAGKPMFAYKIPATALGSTNSYYLDVDNRMDYPIVTDIYGNLFCPTEYKEAVLKYYYNGNDRTWVHDGEDVADFAVRAMEDFLRFDLQGADTVKLILDKPEMATVDLLGADRLVWLQSVRFVNVDRTTYYYVNSAYLSDGSGRVEYTLIELPEEIAEPLQHESSIWG